MLFVGIKLKWEFGEKTSKIGQNLNASIPVITLTRTISFNIMAIWRMTTICVQQGMQFLCVYVWVFVCLEVGGGGCVCA